jgi:beta-lactamase superfamily II metal-dependent hydrolase
VGYEGRSAILGGDASKRVWGDILDHYGEESMKTNILLAPHHGSVHNFHKEAMEAMDPDYIIVSVAVGTDYAYDEYSSIGQVLSTKWRGNIVFSIDDFGNIEYSTEYDR